MIFKGVKYVSAAQCNNSMQWGYLSSMGPVTGKKYHTVDGINMRCDQ